MNNDKAEKRIQNQVAALKQERGNAMQQLTHWQTRAKALTAEIESWEEVLKEDNESTEELVSHDPVLIDKGMEVLCG